MRQLLPWHENISKRQVKSPKVYIADSGLLHTLLGIKTRSDLERHPKIGASWEGFVIEQVIRWMGFRKEDCFFWATHAGAELDLLVVSGRNRLGFEVKLTRLTAHDSLDAKRPFRPETSALVRNSLRRRDIPA